jgi:hypothetical protein
LPGGHSMLKLLPMRAMQVASALPLFLCLCGLPRYAAAQMPDFMIEESRQAVSDIAEQYKTNRTVLEQTDRSAWTLQQTSDYLYTSLDVVYDGLVFYFVKNGKLPATLESLKGTEYIPVWPDNPYNDWQPVRILSLADDFSAGDVVWQICPPEFYSYVRNTRPASCELSIYGPDVKYADFGDAKPASGNTKWAVIPEGAVFMLGQWAEPASVTRKKFEADTATK